MLEKVICLFERLVVAQEKIAENQAAYLEFQKGTIDTTPEEPTKEEKPKSTRAKKEKATEPVEAPKAEEPKKKEPAKPKLTLADVKAAVAGYAEARMKGGSADPKGDARALMAHHGGGAKKTDEIAEEYWEGVVEACKSGWEPLPAKDEEL